MFLDDVEGIKQYGFDPKEVMQDLNNVFYEMIFKHGTIHADPHAKNILVRPNPNNPQKYQIVLLDHGLYSHITPEMLYN